jgi:hypothetical protein
MERRAHDACRASQERVISAIAAAPAESSAADPENLSHETDVRFFTMSEHPDAPDKLRDDALAGHGAERIFERADQTSATWRMGPPLPEGVCSVVLSEDTYKPACPRLLNFTGMIGTMILKFDADASGKCRKARVAAAVPAREFAVAALKAAPEVTFAALQDAPSGCMLARQGKVITVSFMAP